MSMYGSRVIYESKDVPSRNINSTISLSLTASEQLTNDILHLTRRNLAENLVMEIRQNDKFFKVIKKYNGIVQIKASAIVLTHEEYQDIIEKAYLEGMMRASYQTYVASAEL